MKTMKIVILVILGFVSLACDKDKSPTTPVELVNFLPDGDPLPADPGPTQDDQGQDQDQDQDDGQPDLGQNDPNPPVDPCTVAMPDPDQCTTPPVIVEPYRYSGGRGTMIDPYLITNPEDLRRIADNPTASFHMMNDIDMEGEAFTPIPYFNGYLWGRTNEIQNLKITYETSNAPIVAMFEEIGEAGYISQLTLRDVDMVGSSYASGFVGILRGYLAHCYITGKITSPNDPGYGASTAGDNPLYKTLVKSSAQLHNNTLNAYFNGYRVRYLFDPIP